MKKIDRLILGSFIGPFLLTLVVVDFILLLVALLRYFDELFGKGLSLGVFGKLMGYFSISSSPDAFPLAVLLSSIMTFGNLGEHSELTAIKSSGISLIRALAPIFFFVIFLTGVTYYTNTRLVPKINLKTYSLLWDMRTKKPTLNIKEGVFYDGIPGYSIKVKEKVTDEHLKDIIIYNHTGDNAQSNKKVILADSGRMYSFMNQRYLALELFNGTRYEENIKENYFDRANGGQFVRDKFTSSKMVFDLSSFDMTNTDEAAFRRSRVVQSRRQLLEGLDSMNRDIFSKKEIVFNQVSQTFSYHLLARAEVPKDISDGRIYYDSIRNERVRKRRAERGDSLVESAVVEEGKLGVPPRELTTSSGLKIRGKKAPLDSSKLTAAARAKLKSKLINRQKAYDPQYNYERFQEYYSLDINPGNNIKMNSSISYAINQTRTARNYVETRFKTIDQVESGKRHFVLTLNQQVARSFACLVMFLIGAPIGAIIKKGGLGMPLILSIAFFLIYYIMNSFGEKLGKQDVIDPMYSFWISNVTLLPFGLFFLKQARNDARLFESDFYTSIGKTIRKLVKRKD